MQFLTDNEIAGFLAYSCILARIEGASVVSYRSNREVKFRY